MTTRIAYNPETAHGRLLARAIGRLIEGNADLVRVKAAFDAMVADVGSGATYAQIETELGAPAGTGQAVFDLVANALQGIKSPAFTAATTRLDQG